MNGSWGVYAVRGRLDQTLVVFLKRHFVLPTWDGLMAKLFPRRAWS